MERERGGEREKGRKRGGWEMRANTGSCFGPQNKISHPVHRYKQLIQVPVLSARLFCEFVFRNCGYNCSCGWRKRDL